MESAWKRDQYCQRVLSVLEVVRAVSDKHGKASTTALLKTSVSTIYRRLAAAEELLTVPLFEDEKHGALTIAGQRMRSFADDVLNRLESFLKEVEETKDKNRRPLVLGTIKSVWNWGSPRFKAAYQKQMNESITLDLVDGQSIADIQSRLLRGEIDLALISYPPPQVDPLIRMYLWRSEPMVLVASKENERAKHSTPIQNMHDTFIPMIEKEPRDSIRSYLEQQGIVFNKEMPVNSVVEALPLVRSNEGISILPAWSINRKNFKVFTLPLTASGTPLTRQLAVLHRREHPRQQAIDAFIKILEKQRNPISSGLETAEGISVRASA
jgi:DNA-binding transcriptional LysR family regulator